MQLCKVAIKRVQKWQVQNMDKKKASDALLGRTTCQWKRLTNRLLVNNLPPASLLRPFFIGALHLALHLLADEAQSLPEKTSEPAPGRPLFHVENHHSTESVNMFFGCLHLCEEEIAITDTNNVLMVFTIWGPMVDDGYKKQKMQ